MKIPEFERNSSVSEQNEFFSKQLMNIKPLACIQNHRQKKMFIYNEIQTKSINEKRKLNFKDQIEKSRNQYVKPCICALLVFMYLLKLFISTKKLCYNLLGKISENLFLVRLAGSLAIVYVRFCDWILVKMC